MTNYKAQMSNSPRRVCASKQLGHFFSLQVVFTNSIASLKLLNGVKAQNPNDKTDNKTKILAFWHLNFLREDTMCQQITNFINSCTATKPRRK